MPLDRRVRLAGVLLVAFAALTLSVVVGSPVDRLDHWFQTMTVHEHDLRSSWRGFVSHYVMLGQRGPTTKAAFILYVVVCLRRRSLDPMLLFWAAILANNLFVGLVKLGVGRLGPRATGDSVAVFAGGDIFPSGHVTNAVVLFGVIAMTATHFRKALAVIAVWVSLSVGVGTIWLDTHWFSDVVGAWLAGSILLLLIPRFDGTTDRIVAWARRRWWPSTLGVSEDAMVDHHTRVA